MIDPSGHSACDVAGADPECNDPDVQYTATINERLAAKKKETSPSSPSSPTTGTACSGSNWSVVCKDPTLITSGQVETNTVYPTLQMPENYDGPYTDETCNFHPICWILVGADAGNFLSYQTNLPARAAGDYAIANVNYEVHKNEIGYYTTVPSLSISNHTNSNLSLGRVEINNAQLISKTPIVVGSGQSVSINMPAYGYPGRSASVTLQMISDVYLSFALNATYP